MRFNGKLNIRIILHLIIVMSGCMSAGYGIAIANIAHILIGSIIAIIGCLLMISYDKKNVKFLNLIIEAIHNKDYTFRLSKKEILFNNLFNEILEILQNKKNIATQQETLYEKIINSISIGVIVVNKDNYILKCNEEALRLFNRNAFTHISQLASWDNLDNTLSTFISKEKRHVLIKTPNKELNLTIHLDQIDTKDGSLKIFTFNDIHTEIDRNEFDSWIKLTRVLTHEIMNGIAPISSLSDTMKQDNNIPVHIKDGLDAISSSSRSLINFVESYRKFTKIPTPIPTLIYVRNILKRIQELHLDVDITLNIEPADLIIYADEALILQVVTNIVKNAIEAIGSRPDGKIKINARCDENESVKISISNNGPAIPPNEAEEIFVPFFTTKKNGNGIGLSISRQIMILSGGNLSLTSTPENKFTTTFTLTLN